MTAARNPFRRAAGVVLHPTSLPGPNGIGELGSEALRFLDVLSATGLRIWQMLPLGPTGYGDSPYQGFSAFAGNPLLIATPGDDAGFPAHTVDFDRVIPHKRRLLREAVAAFAPNESYRKFVEDERDWLDDYALFMALKDAHHGAAWTQWEPAVARREPEALDRWRTALAAPIEEVRVGQYLFYRQFTALRRAAIERDLLLMGDLPIYVAHDSADVWSHRALFRLEEDGTPTVQAGVPPDYFSATGQLWGNPIYNWTAMAEDGYRWWIRRMRATLEHFDLVRIDHFRGFESYWEVPGGDTTAVHGRWVRGPGDALFTAMTDALGPLPIVAENLGMITPAVEALRERLGFPGMSVLQFAFGDGGGVAEFKPHNFPRERVVYTGTHDNDTTVGWWRSGGEGDSTRDAGAVAAEKAYARRYLDTTGDEIHWTMIRAALASVANTVLVPLQDVLGLGSEARLNMPGRAEGNWRWRFSWDQLTPEVVQRLRDLIQLYDR